ncbi:MAG: hypothetical protein AAGA58_05535 [Verrucomicrobiota bacterium]
MSEFSNVIGDHGEEAAKILLKKLGWTIKPKFDFPCVFPQEHAPGKSEKRIHALDSAFSYSSPLFDGVADLIAISSKYSTKPYKEQQSISYREFVNDVDRAIACLKASDHANSLRARKSCTSERAKSLLFWLHSGDARESFLTYFENRAKPSPKFPNAVVDNFRFSFLWGAMDLIDKEAHCRSANWQFAIHDTGHNGIFRSDSHEERLLPWELMIGGPLVFRMIDGRERHMIICSPEAFTEEALVHMIDLGYAHSGRGWASHTTIAFPDYHELDHRDVVGAVTSRSATEHGKMEMIVRNLFTDSPLRGA